MFVQSLLSSTGFHYLRVLFVFWSKFAFSLFPYVNRHDVCLLQLGFDISTCMLFVWSKVCFFFFLPCESIDNITTLAVFV